MRSGHEQTVPQLIEQLGKNCSFVNSLKLFLLNTSFHKMCKVKQKENFEKTDAIVYLAQFTNVNTYFRLPRASCDITNKHAKLRYKKDKQLGQRQLP